MESGAEDHAIARGIDIQAQTPLVAGAGCVSGAPEVIAKIPVTRVKSTDGQLNPIADARLFGAGRISAVVDLGADALRNENSYAAGNRSEQ
jgi:hypothetical protein